jgi:outer membrane receptor protein involved in Fe transport
MKTVFTLLASLPLLLAGLLVSNNAIAQKSNAKISGTVTDSVTQKPVEFANVALTKTDSNSPIDGAVCDAKGEFTIARVPAPGDYFVVVSFIGFDTKKIPVHVEEKDNKNIGSIIISPTPQILKEVTVEGQKSIIEERVDRMVYNAENDATAKGGDATDVLKRVPMLSVDMDGNVSLRGNSNIMVLVNNKPSTIMASSIADALKQIPADQIKSVEVITSPSAKYDAEGSAGIINIITKKSNLEGVTLNVDSGVGLRGSNLGLNGNYRKGKMGFSLGGFGRANYNVNGSFRNEQQTTNSTYIQSAKTRSNGLFGNYNLGWDYDINKNNSLTASARFGVRNNNSFQDGLTTTLFPNGSSSSTNVSDVANKDHSNNVDANFNYTHTYAKPQRELSVQGLYSRNNRTSNFENIYTSGTSIPPNRLNNNNSYNEEMTIQTDYQTPVSTNQMLELGAKNITRKVFSDYQSYQSTADGSYVPATGSTSLTNNLNYNQNITAGYLSYTYSTKNGYSVKAGSRYEYTTISANTQTESNIQIPSYGVLVPSVNLSRKLKNGNTFKLSYNRRIQRPSIRYLNPNIQPSNNLNITQGDPRLSPEYTNNYELGYSTLLKGFVLNMTGFARNTTGSIQSVRDVTVYNGQQVTRTTFKNIGSENAYGTSIFANVNVGKLSLNGGGDLYYAVLNNNISDPILHASNQGLVVSGRVFGSYNLKKGWGFQFFSFYRGRQVQLQGTQGGFYMYSLALRKEFNEKRGSVGIGLENFLQKSIKIKTRIETPVVYTNNVNLMNTASIRLNFSYRIGKMSMDAPKRRRSINNDDLKEGAGDNGGMGMDTQSRSTAGGAMPSFGGARPQGSTAKPQPVQNSSDTTTYAAEGNWTFTIDSPQGGNGTISILKNNGQYTGTIKTNRMQQETAVNNLVVDKNSVRFNYPVNFGGNTATIEVQYTISKDKIQGIMNVGQFGSFNLTGQKSN